MKKKSLMRTTIQVGLIFITLIALLMVVAYGINGDSLVPLAILFIGLICSIVFKFIG